MFNFLQKNKVALIYYPLFIYWMVLFLLTTLPGRDVPDIGVSDKIEHTAAYLVLSVLLCLMYHFQHKVRILARKPFLMTILTIGSYAALDELHQLFIPGRSCDIRDWTADVLGSVIGLLLVVLVKQLSKDTSRSLGS